MSNREIWGMKPGDAHELFGQVEVGTGISIIVASVLLACSGVGCLGGAIGGLVGLNLVVNGGKELIKAKFDPKYRDK